MRTIKRVLGGVLVTVAFAGVDSSAQAHTGTKATEEETGGWVALPADWTRDDLEVYDTCDAATQIFENMWEESYCVDLVEDSMHLKTVAEREDYVFDDIEGLLPSELSGICYSSLVERFVECQDEPTNFEQNICLNRAIRTYNACIIGDEEVGK